MLVLYESQIDFPSGAPAANYPVEVYLTGGNELVPLFADDTGMNPESNPVTTDSFGLASFWAAPGAYSTWVTGQIFHYQVSSSFEGSVWPDLKIHEQASPSSSWTIQHFFSIPPQVSVLFEGAQVLADISHPDQYVTVIDFSEPVTGTAIVRR